MRSVLVLLALALALVSACGFRPVYAPETLNGSTSVSVPEIPGRMGHELRKALLVELQAGLPDVSESATLTIDLDERLRRLAFNPDQSAARTDLRSRVKYRLEYGGKVIRGEVEGESSFNVPNSPYGDISAQTGARERGARQLAKRIVDDLRIRLTRPEAQDGAQGEG